MTIKRLIPTIAVAAFLLGALSVAVLAGPLWHIGNLSPAAAAQPGASAPPANGANKAARLQAACDAFLNDFAGNLKKTPAEVKAALKKSLLAAIDRAVKAGDMTAQQATAARAKVNSAQGCQDLAALRANGGHQGKLPGKAGMAGLDAVTKAAATALGVTPDALRTAIMGGKTLHEVAGPSATQADFDKKFRAALTAQLQPQVTSGKLTAADQAKHVDQATALADKLWDAPLKASMGGFFRGPHGAPGAPGPGGPNQPVQ